MPTNKHECPGSADVLVGTRALPSLFTPRAWQSPHAGADCGILCSSSSAFYKVGGACSSPSACLEKVKRHDNAKRFHLPQSSHMGELQVPPLCGAVRAMPRTGSAGLLLRANHCAPQPPHCHNQQQLY
jgi:hypothetical protein